MVRRRAAYVIDETAGWLARRLHRRSSPHPNTRRELSLYLGKQIAELFPPPPGLPNVTMHRRWKFGRFKCDDLTFASFHEPICPKFRIRHELDYETNHTVHVRWFRHRSRARRPTLIYLHSWMYPETVFDEFTLVPRLARTLGVDIARLQLPYHGKRKPAHSIFHGELFWSADLVRSVEAIRQSVMDTRTLLGWLQERRGLEVGVVPLGADPVDADRDGTAAVLAARRGCARGLPCGGLGVGGDGV
ncbi:MAG: hypothetical protein KC466_12425, partial [Myxococcales bacterium]|nr:hypothetical protein [Myxococcales bacterium]